MLVRLMSKNIPILENWSIGFLIGLGLTTFTSFVFSWVGIKITYVSVVSLLLIGLIVTVFIFFFLKRNLKSIFNFNLKYKNKLGITEKIAILAIIVIALSSLLITIYYPVNAWDALALYDFRARVIVDFGYFVQIAKNYTYFSHYPLFTSLTHTFVYLSGGKNPQFLYSLYLISFAVAFYSLLKRSVKRNIALLSTLFLMLIPELFENSTISYTNLPYTAFYVLGIIYLLRACTKKQNGYILLGSLLVGLSTWVRSDLPFWITGVLIIAIYSWRVRKITPLLLYLPPFLIIQQVWNRFASGIYGNYYTTTGQLSAAGLSVLTRFDFNRVVEVFVYLYKNVFFIWGFLSIIFIISILIHIKQKMNKESLIILSVILFNLFGLFVGTYIFSFRVAEWKEIGDSATRMSMFFPPLIIYYVSTVLNYKIYEDRN